MAKAAAMLMTFLLSAGIGARMASRLQRRQTLLKILSTFFRRLMAGMAYRSAPLSTLVQQDGACEQNTLLRFFAQELQTGKTAERAWNLAMERAGAEDGSTLCLTDQDQKMFSRFVSMLGKSDMHTQTEHAALLFSELREAIGNAETDCEKRARLYRSVGALCGGAAAILLL